MSSQRKRTVVKSTDKKVREAKQTRRNVHVERGSAARRQVIQRRRQPPKNPSVTVLVLLPSYLEPIIQQRYRHSPTLYGPNERKDRAGTDIVILTQYECKHIFNHDQYLFKTHTEGDEYMDEKKYKLSTYCRSLAKKLVEQHFIRPFFCSEALLLGPAYPKRHDKDTKNGDTQLVVTGKVKDVYSELVFDRKITEGEAFMLTAIEEVREEIGLDVFKLKELERCRENPTDREQKEYNDRARKRRTKDQQQKLGEFFLPAQNRVFLALVKNSTLPERDSVFSLYNYLHPDRRYSYRYR